jgi:hypothetical protein
VHELQEYQWMNVATLCSCRILLERAGMIGDIPLYR